MCNHLISVHLVLICANELWPHMQRSGNSIKQTLSPLESCGWTYALFWGQKQPFPVTWETTFYKEGAWDRPVLTGRQELVTLWKLQGIGLVKMRSDRILICLSLLCRHTDVKGKRRGCVVAGAGVIGPSRLIEKLEGKKRAIYPLIALNEFLFHFHRALWSNKLFKTY